MSVSERRDLGVRSIVHGMATSLRSLAMTEKLMEFNVFIYFAYIIISPLIFLPYWFKSEDLNQDL